eukprot:s4253_g2.t1
MSSSPLRLLLPNHHYDDAAETSCTAIPETQVLAFNLIPELLDRLRCARNGLKATQSMAEELPKRLSANRSPKPSKNVMTALL